MKSGRPADRQGAHPNNNYHGHRQCTIYIFYIEKLQTAFLGYIWSGLVDIENYC